MYFFKPRTLHNYSLFDQRNHQLSANYDLTTFHFIILSYLRSSCVLIVLHVGYITLDPCLPGISTLTACRGYQTTCFVVTSDHVLVSYYIFGRWMISRLKNLEPIRKTSLMFIGISLNLLFQCGILHSLVITSPSWKESQKTYIHVILGEGTRSYITFVKKSLKNQKFSKWFNRPQHQPGPAGLLYCVQKTW